MAHTLTHGADRLHRIYLSFYDVGVEITSDDPTYFATFSAIYRRFLLRETPVGEEPALKIAVFTRSHGAGRPPALVVGEQVWPLDDPTGLQPFVYEQILGAVSTMVRSHILIHAGVVARNGQATILVGDSQHGKTTLVHSLLRRGYDFLSDEMGAISRSDGMVYPFPRSLQIRPESLGLAGDAGILAGGTTWLGKYVLDPEEIRDSVICPVAKIRNIILLTGAEPAQNGSKSCGLKENGLRITLTGHTEEFVSQIRELPNVQHLSVCTDRELSTLEITSSNRNSVIAQVEAVCRRHGVVVYNIQKREENRPDYDVPVSLEPLPRSAMIKELLRRFQGTYRSLLLTQEHNGSGVSLYLELAQLIRQAHCYRLGVGKHEDMVAIVNSLNDYVPTAESRIS
jgi:hypothetical protein